MRLRSRRAAAGLRLERFSSSGIRLAPALDAHEVADLPEHTDERRALLVLRGAADLAQPERAQRAAVRDGLPDRATRLRDLELRHSSPPRTPSAPRPAAPAPPGALAPARPARPSGPASSLRPRDGGAASGRPRSPWPWPTPTRSTSSPITTGAVNENRRPPLTTFATRLSSPTRSLSSMLPPTS